MKELSQEQIETLTKLKQSFPFRIVYGALNPETNEFQAYAVHDRRRMNNLLRKGWLVFQAN